MSELSTASWGAFSSSLVRRAVEDQVFRQNLVDNPREIIEAETGEPLPESVQVVVLEDDANTLHVVLPPQTLDLEIEDVSGGIYSPEWLRNK